ncbi:oligosaccharide flippase family protein [Winogradskyella sp. SYSU M77433]|uniref:lipopolysaccharide biosynthesis protein n=1 Tax=Winogradskyella sp. SYSU M77433 TaxID=3042722 RepID=UPI0024809D38|nr:oligosaccharide flippase family protein [Winogradskyella sp. SYSU M77433]MDH7911315.1 oligosaccharide flippase family protein [Winogradskyella sp. SYSU M77433]
MKKLIHKIIREDNFLSLSGNLIIALLGFGGFALLARSLETEEFAQWVLFISGGSLVEMLRYGITNNGLVRFLSGATDQNKERFIGANVVISFCATLIIALILIAIKLLFSNVINTSSYALFFKWYPVLAFVNLPLNNALVVQQAKMKYDNILFIKALNSGLFFSFLLVNTIFLKLSILEITIVFLLINTLTSLVCIGKSWDGLLLFKKANKATLNTLLNFGKYSTFTLIGTNLLRNADILIISISPFGSTAVALFSIPLKLTEIQQIPLRSFTATAFPKMSKASLEGKTNQVKELFNVYSGAITYLFFAVSIVTFVFAKEFVMLISGTQYLDEHITGIDIVSIVKILSVYGLLLPIDRMTGIGLDSINKPNINAIKVLIMLVANIIGDLVSIYVFHSIEMVAVSTLIFTTVGIVVGAYFLNKSFKVSLVEIFKSANLFYKNLWYKSKQFRRRYPAL